jgi:hypothetical protein
MANGALDHYIRAYDDDLDAALCQRLVASFESLQRFQRYNGRGVRAGLERSGWTELNISRLSDEGVKAQFRALIDRALARYNADIGLTIPIPNSPSHADLVMKRYRPGAQEGFQLHFDAVNHMANRYLVLLWYLNDVAEGGETRFPQLGTVVAPRAGRLVVFPPYWMYQHEGAPPVSGDKYIISTYLLFEMPQLA